LHRPIDRAADKSAPEAHDLTALLHAGDDGCRDTHGNKFGQPHHTLLVEQQDGAVALAGSVFMRA
jgi:hypothetical protein